jgi:hypothetical protein
MDSWDSAGSDGRLDACGDEIVQSGAGRLPSARGDLGEDSRRVHVTLDLTSNCNLFLL